MSIHFGTDGWRAVIGEDFNEKQLQILGQALAHLYKRRYSVCSQIDQLPQSQPLAVLIGYDTRYHAREFAKVLGQTLADQGFRVQISDRYCPTPALCWTVAHDRELIAGIMLTASHNPAEYLGVKLRMEDGGASPASFTSELEEIISEQAAQEQVGAQDTFATGELVERDIMTPYLSALLHEVDLEALRAAQLRVVHDPMYGASRAYVAELMRKAGVEVHEIHGENRSDFGGLHPEPIHPWIDECCKAVLDCQAGAAFINDGDADRVGAVDELGNYVSPHKILALVIKHLLKKSKHGRVVSTLSASSLLSRLCEDKGIELCITPVGFKWIYEQMLQGDVLVGGEESGGIGIPSHVMERDGLLMDLLLCEMMAQEHKSLHELVCELEERYGTFYYQRNDMRVSEACMEALQLKIIQFDEKMLMDWGAKSFSKQDGLYLEFADDAWLLLRCSGTEPLVRVYAESLSKELTQSMLNQATSYFELRA